METVGQRIKRLREALGISQAELATRCGWASQSRIGNYETDSRKVNVEDVVVIASALKVSPGELIFGTPDNAIFINQRGRDIPLVSYVQAGAFTEADSLFCPDDVESIITCEENISELAFALRIKGDSMEPEFKEGDTILVDPAVAPSPGEFVVAKNGDHEATFKKYRPKANGAFELIPLNPDYPTIDSELQPTQIIGTMVEHRIHRRKR